MQVGICYSSRFVDFAARLAARLERNFGVSILLVGDDSPLSSVWEQATGADAVLLLLDKVSAPGPVNRADWESLLEHSGAPPVAVIPLEPCAYPKLLERRHFFLSPSEMDAERWVERWLVGQLMQGAGNGLAIAATEAPLRMEWFPALVDTPGVEYIHAEQIPAARTFANHVALHFQSVHWISCWQVPAELILGEIAHRSRGQERHLFVLVHVWGRLELPESRHSFLILPGEPEEVELDDAAAPWIGACQPGGFPAVMLELMRSGFSGWEHLVTPLDLARWWYLPSARYRSSRRALARHCEAVAGAFSRWRLQPGLCALLTSEAVIALRYGFEHRHEEACELGLQLALFLLNDQRLAEAVYWLRAVEIESAHDADPVILSRVRRELAFLVDEAGAVRPQLLPEGNQLAFDFGDATTQS